MRPSRQQIAALILLALGAGLWWTIGRHAPLTIVRWICVAAALLIAVIPMTAKAAARFLNRIAHPSTRLRGWTAVLIAIIATLYLLMTGLLQGREWIPKHHDEHSYLLQMQMLAKGRLWMPQHPLNEAFETFHVLVEPVYAGIYFPGTAILYVPSVWLGLPFWVMPAIVSGAIVGLMYRIVTELLNGAAGALAAVMLLALLVFRYLSLIVMSHNVLLLLGLLLIWAWLRWRENRSLWWMLAIGALAGWAAITRPADALAFAVPVATAILLDLRKMNWERVVAYVAAVMFAAAPFLFIQLIQNWGVTGKPFTTPYRFYADLFSPQLSLGFHRFDPARRLQTQLPQKHDFYQQFLQEGIQQHRPDQILHNWATDRLPLIAALALPSTLLLALVPVSILGVTDARRAVFWMVLPSYVAVYSLFAFLLPHYVVVLAPALILMILLGKDVLEQSFPRVRNQMQTFLTLSMLGLAFLDLPELNRRIKDDPFVLPVMTFSYKHLPSLVQKPAIVLFRYHTGVSIHEEPVYNIDVAWPDDAPIIRAHDLGPEKNQKLVRYYAQRQPGRHVYMLDRATADLIYYGTVTELAKRLAPTAATSTSPLPPAATSPTMGSP